MDLFRNRRWDLVGKAWLWYTISVAITIPGLIMWMAAGLNLGIDFTGGAIMKYEFAQPLAAFPGGEPAAMEAVRRVVASREVGYEKNEVQVADQRWVIVRINEFSEEQRKVAQQKIQQALEKTLGSSCGAVTQASDVEFVGPVVGEDLKRGAEWALIVGVGGILIYVSLRYRFRFAVAAIIALVHDVLILTGVMALLRVEVNSPFVATILTVFGYSINDTVVIFDRIRENQTLHRQAPFAATVNSSLLQTMARSVNTVLTVEITLICLYFFGGASIKPFALSLIVGITSGCYSSIFNASQLLVTWQRMWEGGAGQKLWWRAILALAPALAIGVTLELIASRFELNRLYPFTKVPALYWIAVLSYVVGLLLTKYFSVGALRVLAGVPASRGGVPARAAAPARPVVSAAAGAAGLPTSGGAPGTSAMEAASAAAAEARREERRERREQRKTKDKRKAGDRKKRF
ncbi:MAG: protein translocase subunit SecF [Armatimonadetes bacterium]|nr:protein translocase subunit SecF [Armatimonadota bacterium]